MISNQCGGDIKKLLPPSGMEVQLFDRTDKERERERQRWRWRRRQRDENDKDDSNNGDGDDSIE